MLQFIANWARCSQSAPAAAITRRVNVGMAYGRQGMMIIENEGILKIIDKNDSN